VVETKSRAYPLRKGVHLEGTSMACKQTTGANRALKKGDRYPYGSQAIEKRKNQGGTGNHKPLKEEDAYWRDRRKSSELSNPRLKRAKSR